MAASNAKKSQRQLPVSQAAKLLTPSAAASHDAHMHLELKRYSSYIGDMPLHPLLGHKIATLHYSWTLDCSADGPSSQRQALDLRSAESDLLSLWGGAQHYDELELNS